MIYVQGNIHLCTPCDLQGKGLIFTSLCEKEEIRKASHTKKPHIVNLVTRMGSIETKPLSVIKPL